MHAGTQTDTASKRPDIPFTGPDLCALTARDVVAKLRAGEVSPLALIDAAEARSNQVGTQNYHRFRPRPRSG